MVFFILLARLLGPTSFAFLAISIAVITITSDLADLGVNNSLVRFIPLHIKHDRALAYKFLKLGLEVKLIIWVLFILLGGLLLPLISTQILKRSELLPFLYITLFGTGGVMLFSYAVSAIQSLEKFWHWSSLFIVTNLVRLLVIVLLALVGVLSSANSLLVYSLVPFLGFGLALFFLPTKEFLSAKRSLSVAKEFFSYGKWITVITGCFVLLSRIDIFLNVRYSSIQQTGIYSSASQLAMIMPQLIGALGVVIAPKFASFRDSRAMMGYFKKVQVLVISIAALILLVLPIGAILLPLFLGPMYRDAFPIFAILVIASLISLISIPMQDSIRYFYQKPKLLAGTFIIQLVAVLLLGMYLGNLYQSLGIAFAVLISSFFNFIVTLLIFLSLTGRRAR